MQFSNLAMNLKASEIRELLKLTTMPEVISFAGGLPAPELFPTEQLKKVDDAVLTKEGREALQYGTTEGYNPLRKQIAARMKQAFMVDCDIDNITITSGSQQGLSMLAQIFINPGDVILVEEDLSLEVVGLDEVAVDDPDAPEYARLIGPNLWPAMPGFRDGVLPYYRHPSAIGAQLFGGVFANKFSKLRVVKAIDGQGFLGARSLFAVFGKKADCLSLNVVHTLKALAHADGPGHGGRLNAQGLFNVAQKVKGIAAFAVKLVDKGQNGRVAHAAHFHELAGLGFNTLDRVDDHKGRVHRREHAVGVF